MRGTWLLTVTLAAAECCAAAQFPLEVPFFKQREDGCGAASVAMVIHYWSRQPGALIVEKPSPEQVYARLYRPEQRGILLADMRAYLEGAQFRSYTFRGGWPDIEAQLLRGRPLIVGLKGGRKKPLHFVVVSGVGDGFLWLHDPTRKKPQKMKRSRFEKEWGMGGYWILLATP